MLAGGGSGARIPAACGSRSAPSRVAGGAAGAAPPAPSTIAGAPAVLVPTPSGREAPVPEGGPIPGSGRSPACAVAARSRQTGRTVQHTQRRGDVHLLRIPSFISTAGRPVRCGPCFVCGQSAHGRFRSRPTRCRRRATPVRDPFNACSRPGACPLSFGVTHAHCSGHEASADCSRVRHCSVTTSSRRVMAPMGRETPTSPWYRRWYRTERNSADLRASQRA
jgi:hypothetical protein